MSAAFIERTQYSECILYSPTGLGLSPPPPSSRSDPFGSGFPTHFHPPPPPSSAQSNYFPTDFPAFFTEGTTPLPTPAPQQVSFPSHSPPPYGAYMVSRTETAVYLPFAPPPCDAPSQRRFGMPPPDWGVAPRQQFPYSTAPPRSGGSYHTGSMYPPFLSTDPFPWQGSDSPTEDDSYPRQLEEQTRLGDPYYSHLSETGDRSRSNHSSGNRSSTVASYTPSASNTYYPPSPYGTGPRPVPVPSSSRHRDPTVFVYSPPDDWSVRSGRQEPAFCPSIPPPPLWGLSPDGEQSVQARKSSRWNRVKKKVASVL